MLEHPTSVSESSSLPTPSASQEPGWTTEPVDKNGNPVDNPNERWYNPKTGRHMQKGIIQVLTYAIPESSLLRSPTASQGEGGALGEETARARGNTVGIRDQAMDLAALNFLPTTRAQHGENRNNKIYARDPKQPQNLENALATLPTPASRDHKDGTAEHKRDGVVQVDTVARAIFNSGEVLLPTTRTSMANGASQKEIDEGNPKARLEAVTNWGKFEPAIRRWEQVLDRPAPAPTKPDGKEGAHRLSSRFTEWMMGVPEGWITDIGLTRNEELKACGNGVVPQQAELALRMLLEGMPIPAEEGQVNLPTPTVMDQREGKTFRSVAVKNLAKGKNRGLNLNNIAETGLMAWEDGDTFEIIDGKAVKK
jgi:hypothetical protein